MAYSDSEHWQCDKPLSQCMAYMLENQIMCDVTFLLGAEHLEVHAHKYMLVSRSPVFHAMLDGPLADSGNIEIPDIDKETFMAFLRFVYTDDVSLTVDNVRKVMYAAKKYCVDLLTNKCKAFLKDNINLEEAFELMDSAFTLQDEDIYKSCLERIKEKRSVSFHASPSDVKDYIHPGETIVFDKCTTNEGEGYNSKTGIFTAPRDGTYVFAWTIVLDGSRRINVDLILHDRSLALAQADGRTGRQNGSGSNTVVVNLKRGDMLYLRCGTWGHASEHRVYGHGHSTFSGWTIK